jgi:hypothetical protein
MVELTEKQFDLVNDQISSSIGNRQLCLELIDHACCHIEKMLENGIAFDEALKRSISLLAPDGLHDIEVELDHVLKPKIPTIMKTSLYFFGFIAAFFILLGIMFRIMHWPGADVLLIIGDMSLIFCMLTLLVSVARFSAAFDSASRVRTMAGAIGGFLLGVGGAFKVLHWPSASIQLVLGITIITFVFLPMFFWQLYKKEISASK